MSPRPDRAELATGRSVGRFQLVRPLGEGAQAVVWLAHDARLDRQVALKIHLNAADGEGLQDWLREARAVARLTIRQMPIKPPEAPKQRMQPSAEAKAQASRIAAGIGDERLRSALERLGAAAITRQGRMARPKDGGLS